MTLIPCGMWARGFSVHSAGFALSSGGERKVGREPVSFFGKVARPDPANSDWKLFQSLQAGLEFAWWWLT